MYCWCGLFFLSTCIHFLLVSEFSLCLQSVCWWSDYYSSVFPLCCSTGGASHVRLAWPKCEAGTCTFSQDVHMSVQYGLVHILRFGAQTYGQGRLRGGGTKKWGWARLKIPPGNFIHTRGVWECVNNMFCYSDLLKWLKAGAKNKAVDLWGLVSGLVCVGVCLSDHVQHEDMPVGL